MTRNSKIDGCGGNMPPLLAHVKIYFDQKGLPAKAAEGFYKYYKDRKWKTDKGCPILNWKVTATNWIWMHQQHKPLTIEMKLRLQVPASNDIRIAPFTTAGKHLPNRKKAPSK
ncbi:hypothetical protein SAMN04488128_103712 [Chitinophaga eiseniae]|uniref:Uncharacterized protein n=1 Tax=Chitinophaga eiseniae TaxID=634771 RepID=A0A1T4SXV5_9BACT|nr:hypothetical protein [Chitinophaga eiseniae]SKA32748.1 hypothetical protein SAMN04488128_103712 [Chitinophaga eiseniae]